MSCISLTKRLSVISDLIQNGALVADIGTDHALLPISLIQSGKTNRVIASDIVQGPLNAAKKNISAYSLDENITLVQSDGLENITRFAPQSIVIAGMGGETIRDILSASDYPASSGALLILQPMTHCELLRKYLIINGFSILDEKVVREQHRFYVIITAKFLKKQEHYFKTENAVYELGGISPDTFEAGREYLLWQKKISENTLAQIKTSANPSENSGLIKHFTKLSEEIERRLSDIKNT